MSLRLAVLASGRGSNLAALMDACSDGRIAGEVVGVFSDKPSSGAVALAAAHGIPIWARAARTFADREAFDTALFDAIEAVQPDLIVCAGYMRIISAAAIARFPHRMINIHPSLLPRHPGLHTHQRALDAGDTEHGASVHVVIPELDAGPVLSQVRIGIDASDTAETLAQQLLPREHALLVETLAAMSRGELHVAPLQWRGVTLSAPLNLTLDNRLESACI